MPIVQEAETGERVFTRALIINNNAMTEEAGAINVEDVKKEEYEKYEPCKFGHKFFVDKTVLTIKHGLFGLCQAQHIFLLLACSVCGKCADTNAEFKTTKQAIEM